MATVTVRTHTSTLRFCAVTTAVSAAFWIAGSLIQTEVMVPELPVSAGMFIAPAIGAWFAGPPRLTVDDGPRLTQQQAAWRWFAWLMLMPAVLTASCLAMRISGLPAPDQLGMSVIALAGLSLVFVLTSACEEVGWTRFLSASLTAHWSLLSTGLAVGGMWAALHVIPYLQAGRSWSWVAWQCAFTLVFRIIIVSAVALSGGSWAVAVALHAAYDVAWAFFEVNDYYDPRYVTPVAVLVVVLLLRRAGRRAQAT